MINIRVQLISHIKNEEPKLCTNLYSHENIYYSFIKDKPKAIIKDSKFYILKDEVFDIDNQVLVLFYHNEEI